MGCGCKKKTETQQTTTTQQSTNQTQNTTDQIVAKIEEVKNA